MKRSEINAAILEAKRFFEEMKFHLPPWAYWSPAEWKGRGTVCSEIVQNMLGWDITDFAAGDFDGRGLLLFTIRNGKPDGSTKPYAEKIMIVREGQETPYHYHWNKMEDIINRGGGNLVIELYPADSDDGLGSSPLRVHIDGIRRTVEAGEHVVLEPGESITLEPHVYHRFYGERGHGPVLTGEVSAVNDDNADNRFLEPLGRFPEIAEDEEPVHLLVQDYARFI